MRLGKLLTTNLFQPQKPREPKETHDEFSHITQEMYKKNFELAEKNKTLLILRRIDELILSSVTDPKEIAHAVTKMLVEEAEFKIAAIYTVTGTVLRQISLYEPEGSYTIRNDAQKKIYEMHDIPLTFTQNLLIRAVTDKTIKVTGNIYDLFIGTDKISQQDAKEVQLTAGINTVFVYPLITRAEPIGAMAIGLSVRTEDLSEYQKDLLSRLYDIVGIAIDNALLYNQVQESNAKLKALDKLKDEFVSVASHELRTPMTAIKSYLWMVLNNKTDGGQLNDKQKHYLDIAYAATERLIKLVNNMLNVSRIESGRIVLEKSPISYDIIVQSITDELLPRAQELSLHLTVSPHQPLPLVLVDQDKIREVFVNLIGNSLKFTPEHGAITISFTQKDGYIITEVADDGKGILPEDMPKLFQKFGLIEGSYTQKTVSQGTGLGLYITKSIVELHGGKIWVESDGRDKGTRFYFSLPIYTNPVVTPGQAVPAALQHPLPPVPSTSLPPAPSPQG